MHAFLPKLAEENRQLEAAVEAGHGTAFNIEVEEETDKPTIQMNFALGLMDNAVPDHHDDDDSHGRHERKKKRRDYKNDDDSHEERKRKRRKRKLSSSR